TWRSRDERHPHLSQEPVITEPNPPELPGLGYLPRDVNIIAALRPADLLESPVGKKLLEEPRPFVFDAAMAFVEKWTGIKSDNIDHLVAAIALKPKEIGPLILVVQTRRPYHPDALSESLKAKWTFRHDLPLFKFHYDSGQGYLWCVNPRALVVVLPLVGGLREDDLDNIPSKPWEASERMALRGVLNRMAKDSQAWFAAYLLDPALLDGLTS